MCLYSVDRETKEYKGGYKIFHVMNEGENKGIYGDWFHMGTEPYPLNKWIEDINKFFIVPSLGSGYKPGFHFFVDLDDAREYHYWVGDNNSKIFKIEVDKMRASGIQIGSGNSERIGLTTPKVGVAGKMKILEEVK